MEQIQKKKPHRVGPKENLPVPTITVQATFSTAKKVSSIEKVLKKVIFLLPHQQSKKFVKPLICDFKTDYDSFPGHDSESIDWNSTREFDYNPYSEEERSWDPYSDKHKSDY